MIFSFSNIISFVVSWVGKNVEKRKDNPFGGERVTQFAKASGWLFYVVFCLCEK